MLVCDTKGRGMGEGKGAVGSSDPQNPLANEQHSQRLQLHAVTSPWRTRTKSISTATRAGAAATGIQRAIKSTLHAPRQSLSKRSCA